MAGRLPSIEPLDVVTSTNDVALERALAGAPHGFAVLARRQTRGRGRRGHVWESPAGNVYLSVVLRPGVDAGRLPGIALACGLGSLDGLDRFIGGNESQVKWPNDLVAHGRKLGGMVIECGHLGEEPFAVCGVGVNVASAPPVPLAPATVPAPLVPVGLVDLLPDAPGTVEVAEAVRDGIVGRVNAWADGLRRAPASAGSVFPLLEDYQARLYLLGSDVEAISPEGTVVARGRFLAVDEWGRAVVERGEGVARLSPEQASLRHR